MKIYQMLYFQLIEAKKIAKRMFSIPLQNILSTQTPITIP